MNGSVSRPSPGGDGSGRPFVLTTFFDGDPSEGGGYTQKRRLLDVLAKLRSSTLRINVVCSTRAGTDAARAAGLEATYSSRSRFRKLVCRALAANPVKRLFGASVPRLPFTLDALLRRLKTDLVLFTSPDDRALELYGYNFAVSIWDLCHLDHPEFAEAAHLGEFERREYFLGQCLPKAVAVIADSESGASLLHEHYGVSRSRIHVAPFLIYGAYFGFKPEPAMSRDLIGRYQLTTPYIFYPAQIWAHKNHKYIVEAIALMQREGGWVPQFVFCGADKGGLPALLQYARELGVERHLNYLGFVPDEHLPYLYARSLALVMPTYFGPTNVPPLEANALGVPVCYSDLPSFRSQLGDNAAYVDLEQPRSLVDALEEIRARDGSPRRAPDSVAADASAAEAHYVDVLRRIIGAYRRKVIGTT